MQQPYLFPYLGYWQMVNAVDTFVIFDVGHMIRNGWIHQNQLLQRFGAPFFFRLSISKKHSTYMYPICNVEIDQRFHDAWKRKMENLLRQNYSKAPYFDETFNFITPLLLNDETNLSDYLSKQIYAVAQYLDMPTMIVRAKDIIKPQVYDLPILEKVQLLRDELGFDQWLSLSNGAKYYTKEQMAQRGIEIFYHHINPDLSYPQVGVKPGSDFVPNLSIIDVLMNCGKEGTKNLLTKYTVE